MKRISLIAGSIMLAAVAAFAALHDTRLQQPVLADGYVGRAVRSGYSNTWAINGTATMVLDLSVTNRLDPWYTPGAWLFGSDITAGTVVSLQLVRRFTERVALPNSFLTNGTMIVTNYNNQATNMVYWLTNGVGVPATVSAAGWAYLPVTTNFYIGFNDKLLLHVGLADSTKTARIVYDLKQ